MLGICLGMQLLFETTTENEGGWGLGLLVGQGGAPAARPGLKVPHIGWNVVQLGAAHRAGRGPARRIARSTSCTRSRRWACRRRTCSARPSYGEPFVCAVERAPVYGVQFHPEKSSVARPAPAAQLHVDLRCRRRHLLVAAVPALYPAIDILGGKAVRLEQGDFERRKVYDSDPLDAARRWVAEGATWLHVVDLDGAREGRPVNLEHLERIAGARRRAGAVRRRAAHRRGGRSTRSARARTGS